jgi:proteasome lid subunit RPN8/RPN11
LRISRQLLEEIVDHARAEAPRECCGMVAARDGQAVAVHRARNVAANPKLAYSVDPQDQFRIEMGIDDAGLELGAIYHSHPRTDPVPSQTDINLALHPHALYVIVGLEGSEPDVRAYRIVDGAVTGAVLEVEDAAPLGH